MHKRNIEDQIRHAFYTPSPQTYNPVKRGQPTTTAGGLISSSKKPASGTAAGSAPKCDVSTYVPGPGSYSPPGAGGSFPLPEGGKLNTRPPPPERLEMLNENPKPAPNQYGVPCTTQVQQRQVQGKFSKEPKVSKFIQVEERRTRHIPGPGAHDVQESMDHVKPLCPEGGRWHTAGKPLGYFEQAPRILQDHPDPGIYNVTTDVQKKDVGRVVYKYESATIQESKELVRKIAGGRHEVPGPGAYDLPDLPPVNPSVPELRGREQGAPLPPPFNYNCAPNYSANFSNFTPVRQSNSAAQIWGNGVRRKPGQGPVQSRTPTGDGQADASGGQPLDEDSAVQWRFGGFSQLKRNRSEGTLRPAEHPHVEGAKRQYESLNRDERGRHTFLPMASKRTDSLPVSVSSSSAEYQRLEQGKWQLKVLAENIKAAGSSVLEPLDEHRLGALDGAAQVVAHVGHVGDGRGHLRDALQVRGVVLGGLERLRQGEGHHAAPKHGLAVGNARPGDLLGELRGQVRGRVDR